MASLRILPGRYPLSEQVSKQRVKLKKMGNVVTRYTTIHSFSFT